MSRARTYLGDGVYIQWADYYGGYVLTAGENLIVLEPVVVAALLGYLETQRPHQPTRETADGKES